MTSGAATLQWDRTEARIEMKPGEETARAVYTVTNEGDEPLRIARIKSSCGCTGSVVDRKIIEPGESTEIIATFNKGKRQGTNRNRLEVFLDNQPNPVAILNMIVVIPTLIEAQPQIVHWNANTSKSERTIRITLDKRYVDTISEIQYDEKALTVVSEPDPAGKAHQILRILPKSFDAPIRDTIEIQASGKGGTKETVRIHVFVQP